jgi:hypothetical protein
MRSFFLAGVVASCVAVCESALAAPPQPVHLDFTFPAGAACDFAIHVSLNGKGKDRHLCCPVITRSPG